MFDKSQTIWVIRAVGNNISAGKSINFNHKGRLRNAALLAMYDASDIQTIFSWNWNDSTQKKVIKFNKTQQ